MKKIYRFNKIESNISMKFLQIIIICTVFSLQSLQGKEVNIKTKNTLAVVELNSGDVINYELYNGRIVHLILKKCQSEVIFSTIDLPAIGTKNDASIYKMECLFNIDGQDMKMIRYVPVQESFCEPYIVNGLRIWFDGLNSLSQFYNENHGVCLPSKEARLALQDATLPICPERITDWCSMPDGFPDIKDCYKGENTWMGTYFGTNLHGGLDIDMPSNAPLWAPLSFDDNYYFNSIKAGQNNNRWRAVKHWENQDTWILQSHHLNELLVPEFHPINKGLKYAYTAGTWVGQINHTHFIFRIKQPGNLEYLVDPWIIFWQILENRKVASNELKAIISPIVPGETGELIHFSGENSQLGLSGTSPDYYWSFGDGGFSIARNPAHIYQEPGIYPVTLTLFDGTKYVTTTQHITINGKPTFYRKYEVRQENNPSFNTRKSWELDSYNRNNIVIPNTVRFSVPQFSNDSIPPQIITISLLNKEVFSETLFPERIEPIYDHGTDWLTIKKMNSGDTLKIEIKPEITKLNNHEGESVAYLVINNDEYINSPLLVRVTVTFFKPVNEKITIIDDQDPRCLKSNYFWLTNKLNLPWSKGYSESFLIGSGNSESGFVRYSPSLLKGKYRIRLKSPLYNQKEIKEHLQGFYVNVSCIGGLRHLWINPSVSLDIGEFDFGSGCGYVEISSKNAKGLVIADAVVFEKI